MDHSVLFIKQERTNNMETTYGVLLAAAALLDRQDGSETKLRAVQLRQIADNDYSTGCKNS